MSIILFALVVATVALGGGLWLGRSLREDEHELRWRAAWLDHLAAKYGTGEGR